jgi:hypothetical protein
MIALPNIKIRHIPGDQLLDDKFTTATDSINSLQGHIVNSARQNARYQTIREARRANDPHVIS